MRYTVAALINEGPGMFTESFEHDKLEHKVTITVDAPNVDAALDTAWVVGNREALDAEGNRWPSTVRSLSVGDVLIVKVAALDDGKGAAWGVTGFGFKPLDVYDVLIALLYGTKREALNV